MKDAKVWKDDLTALTEQVVRWGVVYDEADIPTVVGILQLVTADPASVATAKMEVDAVIPAL